MSSGLIIKLLIWPIFVVGLPDGSVVVSTSQCSRHKFIPKGWEHPLERVQNFHLALAWKTHSDRRDFYVATVMSHKEPE